MSEPLSLSDRLLSSIDQLEAMVQARQAGKEVSKDDIGAKTEEIRGLETDPAGPVNSLL